MSLNPQSPRLLSLIAGLSTAGNVCADLQTLAARMSLDVAAVRSVLAVLVDEGVVVRDLSGAAPAAAGVEYRLTLAGWDIVDDLAAVDPRADLDAKQRAYSRAAAAVNRFTDFAGPTPPGGELPAIDGDIAAALDAEELAKHRYDRALARFLQHQRQPAGVR